ncbi:alpha-ketoacid dehydrogenase subunit beta [Sulfobacillus sp. hq2]|uniref:alpha-ketoacid dehydrogenase subunit beta n=1 Tax=Sulfobacillus TaxID=28033 RepID=UPI000CD0AF87|nr:alpha-ketoacid dehydrogenase subunit beta [Sulfobacillus sp. hq2]POB09873.1 alpha-ketoacid dehydrogenase subunit beta [Sulfobacillus sp. hq2]
MTDTLFYWQAVNLALDHALAEDPNVFIMGEDVGLYGGTYRATENLMAKYGEMRVRDTPISENSFTGLGVGAAMTGLRPVIEIMTANFALLALDSIINLAAKIPFMSGGQFPVPLTIRMPQGVAKQLGAQHSQRLEHTLMNVPGLRIAVPFTPHDAYHQIRQAIRSEDPIIILEHDLLYFSKGPVDPSQAPIPMHQAVVRQEGTDITCISYSLMVGEALKAAQGLQQDGISMEVIDLRSLSPIDWNCLEQSVQKTHHVLIAEEDSRYAGAGAELAATLQERCFYTLDAPIARTAGLDIPIPFNAELEQASIPHANDIARAARTILLQRSQKS